MELLNLIVETLEDVLDLIFKLFAFLPVLIIKDKEKLVVESKFKED